MSAVIVDGVDFPVAEFDHSGNFHLRVFPSDKHRMRASRSRITPICAFPENQSALDIDHIGHFPVCFMPFVNYRASSNRICNIDGRRILLISPLLGPYVFVQPVALMHRLHDLI